MAGDILLYQTDRVPIGDDQRQHLELTRNIAERFNQRFGETFTIPEGIYPDVGARIKNLQEPERLMSTTRGAPQGVVRIVDEPDVIRKKVRTAVTDSGTDVRHAAEKPGITNLLGSCPSPPAIDPDRARYDGGSSRFKGRRRAVVALLGPIQALPGAARRRAPASLHAVARSREGTRGLSPDARADLRAHGFRAPVDAPH
jgi:tryptophanyl-tRNA synthetase